jgi:hypothetical protein
MGYFFKMLAVLCTVLSAYADVVPPCAGVPGTDQLWRKRHLRFVLVGEMHGTNEGPTIFGDLVCAAGLSKRPIVVGIERPREEQEAIDAFMSSSNHEAAVQALLSKRGWNQLDGRSSRAMLSLLEKLRVLKLKGQVSETVAFSGLAVSETPAKSEERMASVLMAAGSRYPDALVIALTGNIHASKQAFAEISYSMMARFLPAAETLTLYVADRGGEAWNCQADGCRPHPMGSSGGLRRGVVLSKGKGPSAGYDGHISTGLRASASFPAIAHPTSQPAHQVPKSN